MSRISASTLGVLFREAAERFGDLPAFATKDSYRCIPADFVQATLRRRARTCHLAHRLGAEAARARGPDFRQPARNGSCAITVSSSPAGADVPRGTDITPAEITHILTHSDARFVFVENAGVLEKLDRVGNSVRGVEKIILIEANIRAPAERSPASGSACYRKEAAGGRRSPSRGANRADIVPRTSLPSSTPRERRARPRAFSSTHTNMTSQVRNLPFDLSPERPRSDHPSGLAQL